MSPNPNEIAPGISNTPPSFTETALDELSHKLTVMSNVGTEMGNLFEAVKDANVGKMIEHFKGIFAIAFIGLLSWKGGYQEWQNERAEERGNPLETAPSGPRGMLPDEKGKPQNFETEAELNRRNRLVNMANGSKIDYNIWYEKIGGKKVKKWALNAEAKGKHPKDVLSDFVVKNGSSALIEKTPNTYEEFEEGLIRKLYPLETNRADAINKSAHFLSKCAVGRFQILPGLHLNKIGRHTRGQEGLKNMYEFIKDQNMQATVFRMIVKGNLKNYDNDPIAAAMAYYGGAKAANTYVQEKKAGNLVLIEEKGKKKFIYKGNKSSLTADQVGGGTILSYANRGLDLMEKSKNTGFTLFERTAMALEDIESGGGRYMNEVFTKNPATNEGLTFVYAVQKDSEPQTNSSTAGKKPEMASSNSETPKNNMQQFIDEELKNKEGAKFWAKNLEGNGERTVLTYVPPGVNLAANNLTFIYQFHGTYSEKINHIPLEKQNDANQSEWVGRSRLVDTIQAVDELAKKGKNVVLIYPLSAGARNNSRYDNDWMNGKTENLDNLHRQILEETNIKQEQVSKVEVQGNSSGGKALVNIAKSGTKLVDAYRFLDASFKGWAEVCYGASRKNGSPEIYLVVADTTLKTFPKNKHKLSEWGRKGLLKKGEKGAYSTKIEGLYYYETPLQHKDMVRHFTGWRPEELKLS